MSNTLYKISDVVAGRAKPAVINAEILKVLCANNDLCYNEMEKYLVAPDVTGSRFFDQHAAVCVLLKHDTIEKVEGVMAGDGIITKMMEGNSSVTQAYLWQRLCTVLRQSGFNMKQGRLVGLIEKKPEQSIEDQGQEKQA